MNLPLSRRRFLRGALASLAAAGAGAGMLSPARAGASQAPAKKVTRKEIERAIMCPCEDDCGKVLANCICDYSGGFRKEIDALIARGLTREQILGVLVKKYGPEVLAAPGRSNWLDVAAWVLPFAALGAGGFLIARLLRRWAAPHASPAPAAPAPPGTPPSPPSSYERKLEEELSRFEP
jgi:cytochrome c-type biogenesis protein CcmH